MASYHKFASFVPCRDLVKMSSQNRT